MQDLLEDIQEYFAVNLLFDKEAIFRDVALDKPDEAVILYEYEGSQGPPQIAGATRSVQVVVRSKSATRAKNKARELHRSLMTETGQVQLTAVRWSLIHLRQPPFKLKEDEEKRVYYCFNAGITTYID
ncbi:hypothetical protein D3C75_232950 [compost metagenome]